MGKMSSGMRMLAMARANGDGKDDAPEMRRRRDERGRYMEHEEPEMRRRRDDRGRYMGSEEPEMGYSPEMTRYTPEPPKMMAWEEPERGMRDKNVVNIRDYQDRRQIGFMPAEGMHEREGAGKESPMVQRGVHYPPTQPRDDQGDHLTREEADAWVKKMRGRDGKMGGRWTYGEVKQYLQQMGVTDEKDVADYYALLNAMYTDYCSVAKKHGVDKSEFYFDLARAFLHDDDAVPDKLRVYMEHIAKHDD